MLDRESSALTYILPIKSAVSQAEGELTEYLRFLSSLAEVIVVDGSAPELFERHAFAWNGMVRHVAPAPDLATPMGKVGGVLTGMRLASHERLVIADDDVRYDAAGLERMSRELDDAHVVRPQNYFVPLPWHARWDTGRMLLNRLFGGDWPEGPQVSIRMGSFDDDPGIRPQFHTFVDCRASWDTITDDLPQYSERRT